MSAPAVVVDLFPHPRPPVVQMPRRGRLPRSVVVLREFRRDKRTQAQQASADESLRHLARESERLAAEFLETARRLAVAIERPAAGSVKAASPDHSALAREAQAQFLLCGVALGGVLCAATSGGVSA